MHERVARADMVGVTDSARSGRRVEREGDRGSMGIGRHRVDSLYTAGDVDLLANGTRISVVGRRDAPGAVKARAVWLVRELVKRDVTVVSGLALGVDGAVHEAAMACGGRTVAVIGTPLDRVYPREHEKLQARMMKGQLVVSEFGPGEEVRKSNFIRRNRTMVRLTDASVVVSTGERSGTRSVVKEGLRIGRPVFFAASVLEERLAWVRESIREGAFVLRAEDVDRAVEFVREAAEARARRTDRVSRAVEASGARREPLGAVAGPGRSL